MHSTYDLPGFSAAATLFKLISGGIKEGYTHKTSLMFEVSRFVSTNIQSSSKKTACARERRISLKNFQLFFANFLLQTLLLMLLWLKKLQFFHLV